MRVGFIGLGRMGREIAPRIAVAGHDVIVWNRTPRVVELPLRAAVDVATLTRNSDVVFTMLSDDAAVTEVYSQVIAAGSSGKLFIEMSTVRIDTIISLGDRLKAAGSALLDAPVSGSVGAAREGKLLSLVGGDAAECARLEPVLGTFSGRVVHCGPVSSGIAMKLAVNLVMGAYFSGLAEALALGRKAGLDWRDMLGVLIESPVATPALRSKVPTILGETSEVAFDVAGVCKDMTTIVASANQLGVPTPTGEAALMNFASAATAGWATKDLGTIVSYFAELAGAGRQPGMQRS